MRAGSALSLHRLLLRISFAASNSFAWIFIFLVFSRLYGSVTQALIQTAALYALSQVSSALLTPLCAASLKFGVRRQILLAVILVSAVTVLLGVAIKGLFGPFMMLALLSFAIAHGWFRALYWVPYEVQREAERADGAAASSHLSSEILLALMPVFVGYLLDIYSVPSQFILFGAAVGMLAAAVPLFLIPETYERFTWGYRESFGAMMLREHRRLALTSVVDGIQGVALLLIWPLAIYLMVGKSFALFGSILSLSLLILIIARARPIARSKRYDLLDSLPLRAAIVSSAWIGRLLVLNPVTAIASDAYLHAGRMRNCIDHLTHDQIADASHFIDETTALREISLMVGRMLACFVFVISLESMPLVAAFGVAFVLAAAAAGSSVLISGTMPR